MTACHGPGTGTYNSEEDRHVLIRYHSPVVRERYCLKYFLEVTINDCMTFGKLFHSTTLKFVGSEAGFSDLLITVGFRAERSLQYSSSIVQRGHPLLTDPEPAKHTPSRNPISPLIKLTMAYSAVRIERPSKEVLSFLNFSERWLCKMLNHVKRAKCEKLMRKEPKSLRDPTEGFSIIQRPGDENSRGPATRYIPLKPPKKCTFFLF